MNDADEVVGLWDSAPFDYGAMESSRLALLADGSGWGVWMNAAGGMELTILAWRRLDISVLEIVEEELISGTWEAGRLDRIVSTGPATLLNERARYKYKLIREHPPLSDEPVLALKLDKPLQFTSAYAFIRHQVSQADAPVVARRKRGYWPRAQSP